MLQPTNLDLAYLAGMIDADGYISIQRSVHKPRAPGASPRHYHAPKIGIAGTHRAPHDFAAQFWGGVVSTHHPKNDNHKIQFQWSRCGAIAADMILVVMPFLKIKQQQAQLALELWEHLCAGKGDDPFPWFGPYYDPMVDRDRMWAEMVNLNGSRAQLRIRNAGEIENLLQPQPFPWQVQ